MKVGIDAIGVSVPSLCIDLEVLAKARGVDPAKYLEGIGTWRMGVAPIDEDTVTLAARAASMAMKSADAKPDEIGMLVGGTETAVDHSKPVSSFVQGLLGMLPGEQFEVKIQASRDNLAGLLASAMMTGYFLRQMEQRMDLEASLFSNDDLDSDPGELKL
jgi:3-hydroxy-3-methylglutaryl CoA synthase